MLEYYRLFLVSSTFERKSAYEFSLLLDNYHLGSLIAESSMNRQVERAGYIEGSLCARCTDKRADNAFEPEHLKLSIRMRIKRS